jgi:hypothetical protein
MMMMMRRRMMRGRLRAGAGGYIDGFYKNRGGI